MLWAHVQRFSLEFSWYKCDFRRRIFSRDYFGELASVCEQTLIISLVVGNHTMMTSSNWNIFRVTGPLCGEFTGPGEFPAQRPVTRSFNVFFDLHLNKRLSKQPWGWWLETPAWSLWRYRNDDCRDTIETWAFVWAIQQSPVVICNANAM